MARPMRGPRLAQFQDWLLRNGNTLATAVAYARAVRTLIHDAGGMDEDALRRAATARNASTQVQLTSGWRAFRT